jgi:hypothetical protein
MVSTRLIKISVMKNGFLFILVFLIVACSNRAREKNIQIKSDSNNSEFNRAKIDTFWPEVHISMSEQLRMDSLEKNNRKKYGQTVLKQLAYCNCLYELLKHDSLFRVTDQSYQLMSRDLVIHSRDVIDSIQNSVKKYVAWINTVENPFNAKNFSLFCLGLYESKFLDSLVKSYDNKILKEE